MLRIKAAEKCRKILDLFPRRKTIQIVKSAHKSGILFEKWALHLFGARQSELIPICTVEPSCSFFFVLRLSSLWFSTSERKKNMGGVHQGNSSGGVVGLGQHPQKVIFGLEWFYDNRILTICYPG